MRILTLLFACAMVAVLPAQEEAERGGKKLHISEQAGELQLDYHLYGGVSLALDGINVIRGSSLWVVPPGWTEHIYGLEKYTNTTDEAVVEGTDDGGKRIIMTMVPSGGAEGAPFTGTHVITMTPANKISFDLNFTLNADRDAHIEWKTAAINPTLLIGAPFSAESWDGSRTDGIIPIEAAGESVAESTIARKIKKLTIQSRVGPIIIEANEAANLILFDYRRNKYADEANPLLWMGQLEAKLVYQQPVHYHVSIQLPQNTEPVATFTGEFAHQATATAVENALVPRVGRNVIVPTPKNARMTGTRNALNDETRLYVGAKGSGEIDKAVNFLLGDLDRSYNLRPEVIRTEASATLPENLIVLGDADPVALERDRGGLELPESPDGYALLVDENGAAIWSHTARGLFNGVTTLVQLVAVDEEGIHLKGAEITDWPSLEFRGVHALSGKNAGEEISRALRDLLARYKMNRFVWECEYIVWDSAPELAHPQYAMAKDDARKVVQAADDNMIEIIPLVQSLGHSEWIFVNGNNLDIAEDPEMPYAYMPTNPRTYEFIFGIYQEALDLFRPKVFHIGHDEVTMRGRFPMRSKDSGKDVTQLVAEDINKLHAWLAERGVRVMMWGDMALAPGEAPDATFAANLEEARRRRDLLPRDVIISDWHYAPAKPADYKSIGIWKSEGFETIGAPWFNPNNISNLTQACIANGAEGLLQTTWAGFNFKIEGNESAWYQYWAYILAAHYAWSGDTTAPDALPFRARDLFLDSFFAEKPLLKPAKGYVLDLDSFANRTLADDGNADGLIGLGEYMDLANLPVEELVLNGTRFHLSRDSDGHGAIVLAGRFNPPGEFPTSVKLQLEEARVTSELHFLMAAAFAGKDKTKAGEIVVTFDDGSSAAIDLIYGANLFHFAENRVGRQSRIAWEGTTRQGKAIRLWDLKWKNPQPAKKVMAIAVSSTGRETAPVILAVTGVE